LCAQTASSGQRRGIVHWALAVDTGVSHQVARGDDGRVVVVDSSSSADVEVDLVALPHSEVETLIARIHEERIRIALSVRAPDEEDEEEQKHGGAIAKKKNTIDEAKI